MEMTDAELKAVTAKPIEVLLPDKNLHMAKPSNVVLCNLCEKRQANSLLGVMCSVCFREQQLAVFTPEQIDAEVSQVLPALFMSARIEDLKPAVAACFRDDITTGVFLWGPTGSGKSYAMSAAARKYIVAGFRVRRIGYELLCLKLRDTFKAKSIETEWEVIQPLINSDMLFLEDVGATRRVGNEETDFSTRTLQVLLDTRLEYCKPTFITSNKSLENLAKSFDERIGSRLKLFEIGKMDGEDRRG